MHEDATVIQAICREVSRSASAASPGEVSRAWSSAFTALTVASHGPGFWLQRDLALVSLADTVRYYQSAADPAARLGMPVAWVNRQGRPAPEAGPRPTYEVADLGELLTLLDG